MASAAEIQVLISAQTEELQAGMAAAAASVEAGTSQIDAAFVSANAAVESFEASLKALENVAIFSFAIEGANKLRELVSGINEGEVALLHMSERTGVSVSDLHGLGVAFEATGASASSFERAMRMIETRLSSAAQGTASAQEKFAALGLSWQSLRGLNPEQLFFTVSDAISNMKDSTEKTEAVIGLLGARFGTQLLPALNLGSAGLRQIIDAENQLDPVTLAMAEDSNKLHVAWLALGEGANSLARDIHSGLLGALTEAAHETLELEGAFIELKTFIAEGGLSSWSLSGIVKAFDDATAAGNKFVKTAQDLATSLAKVEPAAGQVTAPDVTKFKPEGSAESTGDNSEAVLMTGLEARQRAIKEEADSELAIWTEAAKNVESVQMSQFALEAEQIKSAAAQHLITAGQETAQLIALNQQELTSKLTTINNEIEALNAAGVFEKDYYDKIAALQAQAAVLQNQYATKALQIQTSTAVQTENAWTAAFDKIGSEFDQLINTMLKGGKGVTAASAFGQLGEHLLEGAIGGLTKDFSTALAQAVESSAAVTAMKNLFTQAFGGLSGGAASGALGGATSGVFEKIAGSLTTLVGSGAQAVEQLLLQVGQAVVQTALLGVLAVESTGKSIPIVGTLFEKGGIVSAAGGALIGGGNFGIPIIAHKDEAVLPADLTKGIQRAIAGGTFGGGGGDAPINVSVALTLNALDGNSAERILRQNGDVIGNIIAQRVRDSRFVGQNVNRGAFRR